jgi:hypothetical protein
MFNSTYQTQINQGFLGNHITALIVYQTLDKKAEIQIFHHSDDRKPAVLNAAEALFTLS